MRTIKACAVFQRECAQRRNVGVSSTVRTLNKSFDQFKRIYAEELKKWSSYKEHKGNALAPRADEGRD